MAQHRDSAAAITAQLRQSYNMHLKIDWVSSCIQALGTCHPDLLSWPSQRQTDAVFAQALCSDMTTIAEACLPQTLQAMHKQLLQGKYVLQIEEVVNMAAAAKDRFTNTVDRCLKLHLTDGTQHVTAMEYKNLPFLHWDCPAGCKLVVENVMVRRGVLLLQPENCTVLGGKVEALETARKRAVACWNKPAEGRSRHEGPRDIFNEARTAAWDVSAVADDVAPQSDQQQARSTVPFHTQQQPHQPAQASREGPLPQHTFSDNGPAGYQAHAIPAGQQHQMQGVQEPQNRPQQTVMPAAANLPYPAFNLPTVSGRMGSLPHPNTGLGRDAQSQQQVQLQQRQENNRGDVARIKLSMEQQSFSYHGSGPNIMQQPQYTATVQQTRSNAYIDLQTPPSTHHQQQQQQSLQQHTSDTTATIQQHQHVKHQQPQSSFGAQIQREASGRNLSNVQDTVPLRSVQGYNNPSTGQQQYQQQQQQQRPAASLQGGLPSLQETGAMHAEPDFNFKTQPAAAYQNKQTSGYEVSSSAHQQRPLPPQSLVQQPHHQATELLVNQGQQQLAQAAPISNTQGRGHPQGQGTPHFTPPAVRPLYPASTHTSLLNTAPLSTVVAARGYAAYAHRTMPSPVLQSTPHPHTVPETPADNSVSQLQQDEDDLWPDTEEIMVDDKLQTTPAVSRQPQQLNLTTQGAPLMVPSSPETQGINAQITHQNGVAMNSTMTDAFHENQAVHMVQQQARPAATAVSRPMQSPVLIDLCDEDDNPESSSKPGLKSTSASVTHLNAFDIDHPLQRPSSPPGSAGVHLQQKEAATTSQHSCDMQTPCETKASSAIALQQREVNVWAETPIQYICQIPIVSGDSQSQHQTRSISVDIANGDSLHQVLILGTFHSSEGDVVHLEDGTGLLQAIMSEQLLHTIFQGFTMQDLVTEHADPELQAHLREVAAYGEQVLRSFHGLMLLQLPTSGSTMPSSHEHAVSLPVLLGLRTLETAEEWQDALDKLLP